MIVPWVDFKAIKQSVSMEMALAYYGVMLGRIHGPYLRGRCPLPAHASKSSNQSFIANTEKNAWACHSDSCMASRDGKCGGNVLDFVAAMEGCSIRDAALKLQDWFDITGAPSLQGTDYFCCRRSPPAHADCRGRKQQAAGLYTPGR